MEALMFMIEWVGVITHSLFLVRKERIEWKTN
jgi:hypothetical protein